MRDRAVMRLLMIVLEERHVERTASQFAVAPASIWFAVSGLQVRIAEDACADRRDREVGAELGRGRRAEAARGADPAG